MTLLGFDTATLYAAIGVWRDGALLAASQAPVTTHSDALLATIDRLVAEAGIAPGALEAIVCGAGPGSFTGLRIGMATAKGLAFALGRPLVLVSSLAALAARAPDGRAAAVIDAYKGEVYAGLFEVRAGSPHLLDGEAEAVWPPEALAARLRTVTPLALVGSGGAAHAALARLPEVVRLDDEPGPRPGDLLRLGAAAAARGDFAPLGSASPTYIRPSEAELARERAKA